MIRPFCTTAFLALAAMSPPLPAAANPLFPNSIVSNDLEFITEADEHVFRCLSFDGRDRREMPDKRGGDLFADQTYVFTARYGDGTSVGIWAHPDFRSQSRAQGYAETVAEAVGKLPTVMRRVLDHVVIHVGDETAFGEDQGHFFVLYSDNIDTRVRNHDIQETVFHESVHATLDAEHARSGAWQRAQQSDGGFITDYAANNPDREDMAESALFAFTMMTHPGRLPAEVEARVRQVMPNRLAFFEGIFAGPVFRQVAEPQGCS